MTILRSDVDAGLIDFSDIVDPDAEPLGPIHPGEFLQEDFLVPLQMSPYRLAKELHVPVNRITAIIKGERAITADTALRLARYFGTSAGMWLRFQEFYDLEVARRDLAAKIEAEVQPRPRPLDHAA